MNVPQNIAKSSVLATSIFWIIGGSKGYELSMIPYMFITYIPVFIVCSGVILFTISPFYWLASDEKSDNRTVFKMYYPYYAIVCFGLCTYGILNHLDEIFFIGFFISAFITTSQSWIWFAKDTDQ